MFAGIRGNHDVADIDFGAQRTGNARVNYGVHRKQVCQNLHTDARVDFSDSALYDDNILSVQHALMELHASLVHHIFQLHL